MSGDQGSQRSPRKQTGDSKGKGKSAAGKSPRAKRAGDIVAEIGRLKKEARSKEDYERLTRKLVLLESLFTPKWLIEGTISDKDNLLGQFGADGYIFDLEFSPEGDRIVLGGEDCKMRVIEAEVSGSEPKVLAEYEADEWVTSVSFSPDGRSVMMGSDDSVMRVLSLDEILGGIPKVTKQLEVDDARVSGDRGFATRFSPDGSMAAIGGHNCLQVVSLAAPKSKNPKVLCKELEGVHVHAVDFSPDGRFIVTGGTDMKIRVFSLEKTDKGRMRLERRAEFNSTDDIWTARFSPCGSTIIAGNSEGLVQLMSFDGDFGGRLEPVAEFAFGGLVESAGFSPDVDKIIVSSSNQQLQILSLEEYEKGKPKVIAEYDARAWISAAAFSPRGDRIAVGTSRYVRILGAKL